MSYWKLIGCRPWIACLCVLHIPQLPSFSRVCRCMYFSSLYTIRRSAQTHSPSSFVHIQRTSTWKATMLLHTHSTIPTCKFNERPSWIHFPPKSITLRLDLKPPMWFHLFEQSSLPRIWYQTYRFGRLRHQHNYANHPRQWSLRWRFSSQHQR